LELRYQINVSLHDFDACDSACHENFVKNLPKLPTVAICAVGYMGDQVENETSLTEAVRVIRSNYEGPASILSVLASCFEERGVGCLVGISSVAGERGRAANYVYGSAKAGFTAFLSGLRNRLAKKGIHVVTIIPGFVQTKMTRGMQLPKKLTAVPDEVASAVYHAVKDKKNVVFVKSIWKVIMLFIKFIPEQIFKNLRI
jgi:short-subunit dehydrogenase